MRRREADPGEPAIERALGSERPGALRLRALEEELGDGGIVRVEARALRDRERVIEHLPPAGDDTARVVERQLGALADAVLEQIDEPLRLDLACDAHDRASSLELGIDGDHPRRVANGARLRQLRGAALREREIARALLSPPRDAIRKACEDGDEERVVDRFRCVRPRARARARDRPLKLLRCALRGVHAAGVEAHRAQGMRGEVAALRLVEEVEEREEIAPIGRDVRPWAAAVARAVEARLRRAP